MSELVFDPTKLFQPATQAEIFDLSLLIASAAELPVSSWQVGDPTRTGLLCDADHLSQVDQIVAGYFASGFLSSAQGEWLTVLAWELFREVRGAATAASGTLVLKNATTAKFEWESLGLTFKNLSTGKTYKNLNLLTLLPGATVSLNYEAEETGSGSTALINSLDLQSTIKGVTVVSSSAAIGVDTQSDASLRAACGAKISGLSPNGAYQAYEQIAKNAALTGVPACRKAQAVAGPKGSGLVTVYLGNVGALLTDLDRLAVESAIVKYSTPVGIMPTAAHAVLKPVNISGQITINPMGVTKEVVKQRVAELIQGLFLDIPIGGGSGPGFTTGNLGSLLLNEKVYESLNKWTPGLVRKITLSSDLPGDTINPGQLLILASIPDVAVYF